MFWKLSRDMESIVIFKIEFLEVKIVKDEMKNILNGIDGSLDIEIV